MEPYEEMDIYATYVSNQRTNNEFTNEEFAGEISIMLNPMPESFEVNGVTYVAQL